MSRPRKHKSDLPPSVFKNHGAYYHVVRGKWHHLGRDLATALSEYAHRVEPRKEGQLDPPMDSVFERMKSRKVDPLSENTVKQYTQALKRLKHLLRKFSGPEQIKQKDAAQVKVLLAIDSIPFLRVKRHKEAKRTRLIKQGEWDKIYKHAGERLQCVMQGLFLTDQRIDDLLAIDERDILDDGPGVYSSRKRQARNSS